MLKRTGTGRRLASLKLTIIVILLVVLGPTLVVVSASLHSASRSYHDSSMRQLLETARTVARSTVNELELTVHMLNSLSRLQLGQASEKHSPLQSISSFANGHLLVHALDRINGQWQLPSASTLNPAWRVVVERAANTGKWQVSDIEAVSGDAGIQEFRVMLAVPQSNAGSLTVATLVTSPSDLLHALSQQGDRSTSVILAITDGQGRILERSVDSEKMVGKVVPDWDLLQQQKPNSGSIQAQTLEGRQIIFVYQRIEGTPGWVAVVGEDANSFNQRAQQPMQVMLLASGITICLALGLGLWLARKALEPIHWLALRAQRIAAGHLHDSTAVQQVPASFVTEFEVLRQSLDQADHVLQKSLQESKTAEQQAHEHLSVLQAAEEQARIGHWTLEASTGLLHCSDMIAYLFGNPRKAMVVQLEQLKNTLKPESYERMRTAADQCLEKGTPYAIEVEHMRDDGSTFTAYLRGWPIRDGNQDVVSIAGTLQDVSEGKEQRERLQALADNLPSGAIFRVHRNANQTLGLEFLSAGLESLTGLSAATLMAKPSTLLQVVAPQGMRRLLRVLQRAHTAGHVLDEEFALNASNGTSMWLHCRAALRYSATGGAVWDGIVRDVTAEREAEAALHAAKNAAERAERAKSDFLATMSHEIRTPMNSVIGMARLALRTDLDAKQRNYLEKINESASVLLGIINDILDFSKIEAGGLVLEGVPFQLESVLNTVSSVTALKAEEKGLEMTFSVDPNVPAMAVGDPLRLGQVLTNLVSNAVKFTEAGDVLVRVSKECRKAGDMLHFAVTDTGIGLSAIQMRSLFQPFTQAQTDISRRYGGTGLGLAISKRLVEMMGGSIGIRSEIGQGSCFFFSIPLQKVEEAEASKSRAPSRHSVLRGKRILIADDNSMARAALAEMAQGFGMEVTLAANGQEAVRALHVHAAQSEPFDMVVLDWHMPIMDGVQAARQIKSDAQLEHMPAVLMVTAYGQDAMLQACNGLPVQGVLLKPVTQSAMFNTLLKASIGMEHESAPAGRLSSQWVVDTSAYAALKGKSVLVADDNALNREVASDFLAVVGVNAITAEDGRSAIAALEQHAVDAVLMDIHMPHMDGLAATQEIRRHARWQHLPIIALTAQARPEDVQQSLAVGMNGHLCKPIDEVALYSTLLQHCNGSQATPEATFNTVIPPEGRGLTHYAHVEGNSFARLTRSPVRRAQLLQGFISDFEDLPARWMTLSEQEDWVALGDLAHQIKGSASYLDAHALCAIADQLENAARHSDAEFVRSNEALFLQRVQTCLDDVHDALQTLQAQSQPMVPALDFAAMTALLARIKPMVAAGNFAAHALLQELLQGAYHTPWVQSIQSALQAFDDLEYQEALAHLGQIEKQLSTP